MDDGGTIFYVTFKDTAHNLGVIDPDKLSRVSIMNKVLMRVHGRRMTPDKKFNLSVCLYGYLGIGRKFRLWMIMTSLFSYMSTTTCCTIICNFTFIKYLKLQS